MLQLPNIFNLQNVIPLCVAAVSLALFREYSQTQLLKNSNMLQLSNLFNLQDSRLSKAPAQKLAFQYIASDPFG